MRPVLVAPALALALALAARPAAARAATVSILRGTIGYEAGPGEANSVTVTRAPAAYRIADPGTSISVGAGCARVTANLVECAATGVKKLDLRLGDGDDFATVSVLAASTIRGGEGSDRIEGGQGDDNLFGEPGDDTLEGGPGLDLLDGGAGADTLSGGTGMPFDVLLDFIAEDEGGGLFLDLDVVAYSTRTDPVSVVLDGVANDGEADERDHVLADVEGALGGGGADELTGDPGVNVLVGGAGDDTIVGGGGTRDALVGEGGDDRLHGAAREEELLGGAGDDFLAGGPGRDTIAGGPGRDTASGAGGRDVVYGGHGRDVLSGGSRADALFAGSGRDVVRAGPGPDLLSARDRTADRLDGGPGEDVGRIDRRIDRVRRVEVMLPRKPRPPGLAARPPRADGDLRSFLRALARRAG